MTVDELKAAVLALPMEDKKNLILDTFPALAQEAMQDPSFLLQLLPTFLKLMQEKGIDMQQLVQLAAFLKPAGGSTGA